eukprot:1143450-Pelagomonas_calceolata.AAC.5
MDPHMVGPPLTPHPFPFLVDKSVFDQKWESFLPLDCCIYLQNHDHCLVVTRREAELLLLMHACPAAPTEDCIASPQTATFII